MHVLFVCTVYNMYTGQTEFSAVIYHIYNMYQSLYLLLVDLNKAVCIIAMRLCVLLHASL